METGVFSSSDLRQMEEHGLDNREVSRQMELFTRPRAFLKLHRPCTPGDGIRVLTEKEAQVFEGLFERQKGQYNRVKFVPASGAATRMFKIPLKFLSKAEPWSLHSIANQADQGDTEAAAILVFFNELSQFAFHSDLETAIRASGTTVKELLERGALKDILAFLLTEKGLHYGCLPKALIKFHQYQGNNRTAFEEHLVEAASYAGAPDNRCRVHFTVAEEHQETFQTSLADMKRFYEKKLGVLYAIDFSLQQKRTDTIAVDLHNKPFRREDGRLLFRPGGHGALIENLKNLNGDVLFIKNIDNVVPDRLKRVTNQWKKILGGLFMQLQTVTFDAISRLHREAPSKPFLEKLWRIGAGELSIDLPSELRVKSTREQRDYFLEKFNRPLRVCGMVRNVGEPGGGPFWVEDKDGNRSCQIVETAQIDLDAADQKRIVSSSTHFNPVDLVCGTRDWKGDPFELENFVDHEAFFISRKSRNGKDLKALELPGLWNGGMAHWNTVFVDVPSTTFNPVKTVNDLLRKEHQPG